MLIRNLKTKQVYMVPDGTLHPKTAYEVITSEQLRCEREELSVKQKATPRKPTTVKKTKTTTSKTSKKKKS